MLTAPAHLRGRMTPSQKSSKKSEEPNRMTGPIFIRPYQAPEMLGVCRGTIYNWAKAGHITIHKRGSASFIQVSEVRDFILGLGGCLGGQQAEKAKSPVKSK